MTSQLNTNTTSRVKFQIKKELRDALYGPIEARFDQRLLQLIGKNTELGKYVHRSFTYKEKSYIWDEPPLPIPMNRLVPALKGEMDSYLVERKETMDIEAAYTVGYITKVLNYSNSVEDYKRLLPECLHKRLNYIDIGGLWLPATISMEDAEAFKNQHSSTLDLIAQRMALNLLL